ncbi:MAG: DUF177 domain-containing protein [Acidobacteriia bacterium]|nr:DUF177 domain-containing protein [Terriglobia bacterium]
MFIALKDLAIQPIVISEVLEPGVVDLRSADFRQSGHLSVEAVASLVSEEVRIEGTLEVEIETACSRCLESMRIPVKKSFDLFYRSHKSMGPVERDEEIELRRPDLDVGFYVGTGLELVDTLREQILIELPMKPVCQVGCQGLCPHCGANRNLASCSCGDEEFDPRWAGLSGLKSL